MEKFIYYNELFLIYKDLLNDKQRKAFDLYYGENFSMQEVADNINVSKSRVGIIIKNTEKLLDEYEEKLGNYKHLKILKSCLEEKDIDIIKNNIDSIIKGE